MPTGAKGTPRRKVIPRAAPAGDDKKIQAALKKLAVQPSESFCYRIACTRI